ncbi:succinylglutamate desuccinylase/aspartoacylase domain-containing protein [Solimicrobium silvestre]|uniref:Succinylglutamate desuccinylase / Aspartoacylase family n=1 Tax=Solimicrobium silvestre TaxID=2099400 RepID=A0A2S9H4N8_9BURK|nr:succinylglutamate desuccinylase/aspartoacylase family protein [Solimicrobium silvestre]PRC94836.1 Succinylglutamate desuccinylase / Aspartoacylase family [Solimicrobium silvestre]
MSNLLDKTNVPTHHSHYFKSSTYTAPKSGPAIIITGAVHGNETCGTQAILRVMHEIETGQLQIKAGMVTFVPIANPLAYQRGERNGERNLNRKLIPTSEPAQFEDYVVNWLCPLLAQHDVLLDLHSFRSAGQPFVLIGPENNSGALEPFQYAEKEHALAIRLGVRRMVDGWLSTYADGVARRKAAATATTAAAPNHDPQFGIGTTEYMRSMGGYALTLECGQHSDASAPEVAYQAILNTLRHMEVLTGEAPQPAPKIEAIRMVEVVDKCHPDDSFSRPWCSFDALKKGDIIGSSHNGTPVLAAFDGYILFPSAQAEAGEEWFYLAKASSRSV